MKGYKMTRPDGKDFYSGTVEYKVGEIVEAKDYDPKLSEVCGRGLHIAKEPTVPLRMNATYPWRLFEVECLDLDIIDQDDEKVRVKALQVIKELDPWKGIGVKHGERVDNLVERIKAIKWKCQTVARKKKISALVRRYAKELSTKDKHIQVKKIKYYTIAEWDSLRDSLRASLWDSLWASLWASLRASLGASLWASLRASLWASLGASLADDDKYKAFRTEGEILLCSALFVGITDDGTAHVVMPDKTELNPKE